jgi:hypothetical protein
MERLSPKENKNNESILPTIKSGKNIANLDGMGTLNAQGGVGGLARFANNQRLNSISHSPSLVT